MTVSPCGAADLADHVSRPYSRYRDSGVEWLGDVPEHWEVRPLKAVLAKNDSGVWGDDTDDHETDGTIVLRSTEQTVDGGWSISDPARRTLSLREKASALLMAGDLVVTKSSGSEFHIGKTSLVTDPVARLDACFSNFMQRLRCLPLFEPSLAWHLLNSPVGRQQLVFHSNTTTGLANLNGTILGEVVTPVPPRDEQRAIAAFLDRETERIDALVEKKRRLIERLQEYRTALITRTVTRGLPPEAARAAGLDPSPRLKPSGVEWLGDVPEHWEVKQLRRAVILQRGHDLPNDERETGDIPVVSSAGVSDSHSVAAGNGPAIVTGRYGSIGEFHLVDGPFWPLNTTLYSINLCGNEVRFLRYLLMNLKHLFIVNAVKSAVPGVDRNDLHPVATVLPPPTEQTAIADYLDSRLTRICSTSAKAEALIARLQEYRTALITAAVTGKIDVREAAGAPVGAA